MGKVIRGSEGRKGEEKGKGKDRYRFNRRDRRRWGLGKKRELKV